jgi:hypothetical protein
MSYQKWKWNLILQSQFKIHYAEIWYYKILLIKKFCMTNKILFKQEQSHHYCHGHANIYNEANWRISQEQDKMPQS